MSEDSLDDTAELHTPRRWRISPVWLIPLAAALIGAWLLYDNLASRGPVIKLEMNSAAGIKAGNTKLKVRSVPVGRVTGVALAGNYKGAVITVQMNTDTAKLLGGDAKFWVVKPRIGPQGVSGLNTIISGAYLQMRPASKPSGKRRFKVQSNPVPTPSNRPGMTVKLVNSGANALSVGEPVVYQGQNVGKVKDSRFSAAKRQTIYSVFIQKPYSQLITSSTQFWLRSGVDLHLSSKGLDVEVGSLQSILVGGITFGQPKGVESGEAAESGEQFKLYPTRKAAIQDRYTRKIRYVLLLDESVRGLQAGAPVEYSGLRIGTVEKVPFYPAHFDFSNLSSFSIPVLIAIEPQRPSLDWAQNWSNEKWKRMNRKFFKHGLRASIKLSSLLTGTKFINLTFDSHAEHYKPKKVGTYPVFPSIPGQIASLQQELTDLMDKLNNLDLDQLIDQIQDAANTAGDTLEQLHQATKRLNSLLKDPATRQLPTQINDTLRQLRDTLQDFQQGAPAYQKLDHTIDRLNQVLNQTAPLMRTLREHPNALIFGHPESHDPVPKANP